MKKTESAWWALILGCILTINCIYGLLVVDDGYFWRGVYVPIWTRWFLLPVGLAIIAISIRAIRRGEGKPKAYTDEDASRAEAEMDAMYLRDHGEPPEKDKKQE